MNTEKLKNKILKNAGKYKKKIFKKSYKKEEEMLKKQRNVNNILYYVNKLLKFY